ncbi:MAG: Polymer-forming cytoskeletal [Candidatus Omnitrophica bacterium ADurb.Bin277]|nr:MAG: Polymer-forming cytoskeletal [Candidatus Omnitrophica bacterium ADurb.Bin277]
MAKKNNELQEKILDVDASMQGTISFKDPVNLRINGSFEGKLDTRGNLTIGENAKVTANINGDNIVIAGKVTGDVFASKSLSILAPAIIQGNIRTPRLSITDGAVLEGHIGMSGNFEGTDVSLTLKDVAQYLEVESKVVEEWAQSRKIPARFENGSWIFSKTDVDHWIQQERTHI